MMDPMTKETREMIRDLNKKIESLNKNLTEMRNLIHETTEVVELMVDKLRQLHGDEWPY